MKLLNAVNGRGGRCASKGVVIKLVTSECLPILSYGTEACPLFKSKLRLQDFVITRFSMKRLDTIRCCWLMTIEHFFKLTCLVVKLLGELVEF